MSRYEIMVFLHVIAAALWVGAGATFVLLGLRAQSAADGEIATYFEQSEWASKRLFMPASLIALVFGLGAAAEGPGFSQMWIVIGLALYALSALIGMAIMAPERKKIHAVLAARGDGATELRPAIGRYLLMTRIDAVVLVAAVFVMVVKPGA